jgi:hypothetical protein
MRRIPDGSNKVEPVSQLGHLYHHNMPSLWLGGEFWSECIAGAMQRELVYV